MHNILGEKNTLELNHEEVEQLRQILENCLVGFLWNGVIATGTERARNSLLEDDLPSKLNSSGHCAEWSAFVQFGVFWCCCFSPTGRRSRDQLTAERHVQELESPANQRQVTGGKDEGDHGSVGDSGGARLFPLEVLDRYQVRVHGNGRGRQEGIGTTYAQETVQQRVVV